MREDHQSTQVYVWDLYVRVAHWVLVAAFTIAFVTEDETMGLHAWAGYVVGALVLMRVVWGFIGPKHARFSDFLFRPAAAVTYVRDLFALRAKRYLGHSPGGGFMVAVLLCSLAVTVATGLIVYAAEHKAGPLAGFFAATPAGVLTAAPGRSSEEKEENGKKGHTESALGEAVEELHEFFANFTLALVIVHIGGVLFASFAHRENLVKSMLTGYKRR